MVGLEYMVFVVLPLVWVLGCKAFPNMNGTPLCIPVSNCVHFTRHPGAPWNPKHVAAPQGPALDRARAPLAASAACAGARADVSLKRIYPEPSRTHWNQLNI